MKPSSVDKVVPIAIIIATGLLMAYTSWLRWPDLMVDFGRELYVPWQISTGKVLYKDIPHFYGPLSHYLNSLLFRLFGPSVIVLEFFNIAVTGVITYLLYLFFKENDGYLPATTACAAFLILFAFAQFTGTGNYNFVTPYSHEVTHGILASLLSIHALRLYLKRSKTVWVLAAGLSAGLVLLTKLEIASAIVLALFCGVILTVWVERPPAARLAKMAGLFAAGLIVPSVAATAYLGHYVGHAEAAGDIFRSWLIIFSTDISSNVFYENIMGTSDLALNATKMLYAAALYLVFLPPLAICYLLRNIPAARRYGGVASFIVSAGAGLYMFDSLPWDDIFRPVPIIVLASACVYAITALRSGGNAKSAIVMSTLSLFAFFLLFKMLFNTHIYHYGFALAMPAVLVSVHAALAPLSAAIKRRWGCSSIFRYAVLAAVIVMLAWHVKDMKALYGLKTYSVGRGGDRVITYAPGVSPVGVSVAAALQEIERIAGPEETFVVMPEGVMLNFLSRRTNPTGFFSFLPTDFTIYGEDRLLGSLKDNPPDYVILAHRGMSEYGYDFFGLGYGRETYAWIMENYAPVYLTGAPPLRSRAYGILILKRINNS